MKARDYGKWAELYILDGQSRPLVGSADNLPALISQSKNRVVDPATHFIKIDLRWHGHTQHSIRADRKSTRWILSIESDGEDAGTFWCPLDKLYDKLNTMQPELFSNW